MNHTSMYTNSSTVAYVPITVPYPGKQESGAAAGEAHPHRLLYSRSQ